MVHPNETSAGEGLTFFGAPKEDNDENSSSVLQFVVNLFSSKKGGQKPSDDVANSSSEQSISSSDQSSKQSSRKKTQKVISPRVSGSEVEIKLRSFSSLFKELPRFMKGPQSVEDPTDGIDDSSSSPSNFKGTELRQYWMPDEQCHECYECGEKFTTFRRRHHCRICGQIFCSRCCNQLISGKIMGVPGMLRSCIYCCKLVLMFAEGDTPQSVINSTFSAINGHNNDSSMEDAIPDSSSIMNESMLSFGSNHLGHGTSQNVKQSQSNTSLMRAMQTTSNYGHESLDDQLFGPRSYDPVNTLSVMSPAKDARAWHQPGFLFDTTPDVPLMSVLGDDVTEDLVKDSTQLHSLWRKINDERQGIEFRDHRLRLRKYSNCITGQELIDWLIKNDWASTRTQGCAIGQALYEGEWLKPVVDIGGVFQDGYVLFQSGRRPSKSAGTNRIEIFPDHFANFPTEVDGADTLQMMTDREPVWVQEIKCEEENDEEKVDGSYDNESETELTWSDAPNTFNEALLYSDEERSTSEKSVVSLSSFVEIDEGNDIIKYKRPNSMDDMSSVISQRNVLPVQPMYDDSSLMSISADYLRSFITWNGNYLNQRWISPSSGWRESDLQSSYLDSHDKRAFHWLRELNLRYNLMFLRQLLHDKNLDLSWADVLVPLAKHAAENIMPNPNVNMDVCHYLQIKKISDRSRNESHVVNGVVCTKNVVHKSMRTDITDPSILLLAIPLEYQRAQLKLAALDPIVRQEREYYKHLISRIGSRKPKVVIVQYTVSHIAQELLLQAGITLVINVKPSVMERIARSTEADIVYSIDQLLLARLGHCARFYIKHHFIPTPSSSNSSLPNTSKTLMYFDGCSPMFGCSIILRNLCDTVTSEELANVKEVLRFIVRAVFHTRLELSYLIDQHGFGSLLKKISSGKRHGSDMVDANKLPTNSTSSSTNLSSTSDRNSPDLKLETLANDTITPIPESPDESLMFKNNIKTLLLSISPLIQPELPFLLTPIGGDPTILKFLPEKLLWSRAFKVQSIDYRQKFLSALDAERRNVLPKASRSSESSMHNKMFFTAPRQPYDSNSMELLENSTHVDSIENSYKERPDDHPGMLVPGSEKSNTHASCYSQQYYTHSGEGQRNVSEAANAKLNVWEQKLIDVIFGPPVPAKVPKKDKFVLSPDYSPVLAPPPQNKKKTCSKLSLPAFNTTMISSEEDDMDVALIRNSKNVHNFVNCCLNEPVTSNSVKDLIADFRAHAGGTSYPTIDVASSSGSMVKEVKQSSPKCAKDEAVSILSRELSNLNGRYPVDCLDPVNHQRISALFSSYSPQSPNAPYFCVLPWVVNIDFYRGNDITLGGFLERYCFRPSYHCPNPACMRTMVEHVRRFVHGNMCMSVVLKELSKPFNQSSILTWSWNHRTKQSSGIRTMSHDAWSMSFAKYLELHLEQLKVPDCGYDSQKQEGLTKQDFSVDDWELRPFNSFQYFLFRDIVASFKCYEIDIKEVVFPDSKLLNYNSELTPSSCQILTDYDDNAVTYHDYHDITDTIAEKFYEAVESILDCIQTAQSRKNASENTEDTPATRDAFYNDFVAALSEENRIIQEQLDDVKQLLTSGDCSVSSVFQTGLQDEMAPIFETLPPQLAKEASNVLFKIKYEISKMVENWNDKLAEAHEMERSGIWSSAKTKNDSSPRPLRRQVLDPRPKLIDDSLHAGNSSTSDSPTLGTLPEDQDYIASVYSSSSSYEHPANAQDAKTSLKLKKSSAADSKLERSVSYKRFSRGSSVKLLVNRLLPGNVLVPMVPMPFPADEHFLLPECISTGIVVRDAEPTSIIAYALSSNSYKMAAAALASDMCEESLSEAKQKLGQIEDEDKSTPMRDAKNIKTTASPPEITADHMNDAAVVDLTDSPVVSFSSSSSSTPPTSPHIETQFSDSTTRFYCNVYFAKMFENLRAKILGGGENQYLTSLSRSVKWLARGGKSGSTFHKTRDDQFILKQMSHFELQSFMQFAPKYVNYVTRCIQSQQATAISKILGAYRISINNSETGRSWKQDVLVIENLFYRKRVGQIFDLKGSVRNRHVKTTQGKEVSDVSGDVDHDDIVFQDENLLKMMCDNPIYVYEHTKHLLMSAISRDAEFLSHNWIMDYSLLVGVDGNNRLVVGIIDFIHKFTWNKKIEMVVKWSSSRSMPTVVSPELYKNRFCEAMGRYFQIVPDRWYGMSMY